jgi:hypothetical protein
VSDPIDIKALDEYLKGNSDIARRYRELGSEDVPPELDRRVLDEARAAVAGGGSGRARSWLRWSAPLAVAASVLLAVTVVIESGVQNDASFATKQVAADKARVEQQQQAAEYKLQEQLAQERQPERQREFAPEPPAVVAPQAPAALVPVAAPPPALAKAESERANSAVPEEVTVQAKALLRAQSESPTPVTAVTSETVDSPAPQVAAEQPSFAGSVATVPARKEAEPATAEADSSADDLSSVSVTGNTRARRAGRTAGVRGTIGSSPLATESRPVADEDAARADLRSDPQKWLEEIRELRRAGKVEEADRAWEQFHKAFPNFPVADDDLARKQR